MSNKNRWEDWQIKIVEERYADMSVKEIAALVGKSPSTVSSYAFNHNIKGNRYYTEEEKEYVRRNASKKSYEQMAKKLGRTIRSVRSLASYMGCSPSLHEDVLTVSEASRLVGVCNSIINRTWKDKGLKIKKVGIFALINVDHFIDFMKTHPERWDATRCEAWYFNKYDWFREKREADLKKMIDKRWGVVNE